MSSISASDEANLQNEKDASSNRRRQLRVKHRFQDQMILEVILATFVLINILVLTSFYALETIQDLFRLKFTLAVTLAVGEIGGLAIIYYFGLKSSHRIAGPVYVIERRLNQLGDGDLTRSVRLRKDDYFKDTTDVVNRCSDNLNAKIIEIRDAALAVKQVVGNDPKAVASVDSLLKAINKFKLRERVVSRQENAGL